MKVKFKLNAEPCIHYEVLDPHPVIKDKEACIKIEVLGFVPLKLLAPVDLGLVDFLRK